MKSEIAKLDSEAKQALVVESIPYAKRLALLFFRERENFGIDLDDYEGAALYGLCDAARRFEPSRNTKFKTFSYLRIRGAMFDLLRKSGGVSKSCFREFVDQLTEADSFEPNDEEEDESVKEVEVTKRSARLPYTFARTQNELADVTNVIDEIDIKIHVDPEKDTCDVSYASLLTPEEYVAKCSTSSYLNMLIGRLPSREGQLLELRYFGECTFDELSPTFGGASKSCISRLHRRAIEQVRDLMVEDSDRCMELAECHA